MGDSTPNGVFPHHAFRWTSGGGMVGLGSLPGAVESAGAGVSRDGSVVVGDSLSLVGPGNTLPQAFRWTSSSGMVGLGFLPAGGFSRAFGVSADGSVVVGQGAGPDNILQAFRWTSSSGVVGLGVLPGGNLSQADAVSPDGSVVLGSSCSFSGACEGFIWDATHGMRSLQQVLTDDGLNLTGWTLVPSAVSPDGGAIVGGGTDPGGQHEGWLAIIPEPGTELLVSMGLMGLAVARWRHHKV